MRRRERRRWSRNGGRPEDFLLGLKSLASNILCVGVLGTCKACSPLLVVVEEISLKTAATAVEYYSVWACFLPITHTYHALQRLPLPVVENRTVCRMEAAQIRLRDARSIFRSNASKLLLVPVPCLVSFTFRVTYLLFVSILSFSFLFLVRAFVVSPCFSFSPFMFIVVVALPVRMCHTSWLCTACNIT